MTSAGSLGIDDLHGMTILHSLVAIHVLALLTAVAAPQQSTPPGSEPLREQRQERREQRQQGGETEGEQRGDTGESEEVDEATDAKPQKGDCKSPYSLKFKYPIEQLLFDRHSERGSVAFQISTPEREWYSEAVRKKSGGWGVEPRKFDCPPEVREKPADWKRERIIAGASRFIGYDYQHHHIPDWDPPKDWKWNKCCAGHQSKGVDCSNFSGWNYNWGLGIHLNTAIRTQAQQASVKGERGDLHAKMIKRPEGEPEKWYEELCKTLQPGDLLYIMDNKRTKATHVIMWIGECGQSPDGTLLIMDSTGGKIKDCEGHAIPCGIHLRPFKKGSWYHKSFSHAHRWVE
jgi:cell wall-associated NlpC family hydrolase